LFRFLLPKINKKFYNFNLPLRQAKKINHENFHTAHPYCDDFNFIGCNKKKLPQLILPAKTALNTPQDWQYINTRFSIVTIKPWPEAKKKPTCTARRKK
jgi:hypothetical protein